jgi:hypothetical protein
LDSSFVTDLGDISIIGDNFSEEKHCFSFDIDRCIGDLLVRFAIFDTGVLYEQCTTVAARRRVIGRLELFDR